MLLDSPVKVCIEEIVEKESIRTYFQPIVSIKKNSIVGVEALSRGIFNGTIVSPNTLFTLAAEEGLTFELDMLCRKKALENFMLLDSSRNDLILFLNFDASIIDHGVVGSGNLFKAVTEYNLNPNNIAIEVNETRVNDVEALKYFTDVHRSFDFLIALDDVGAGHSNLDRLAVVKPDIIKVDMHLVSDIDKEFFKQEVLKSLVNLSKKIGALVVAEGVEREEEAILTLDYGVDMLQGYYFSKPIEANALVANQFGGKREYIADKLKQYALNRTIGERVRLQEHEAILNKIISELSKVNLKYLDETLHRIIRHYSLLECLYVLDKSGTQISESICNYQKLSPHKRSIFRPTTKGSDHSLKKYCYLITEAGMDKSVTEPYISLASGNLCITMSRVYKDADGKSLILCVDTNY